MRTAEQIAFDASNQATRTAIAARAAASSAHAAEVSAARAVESSDHLRGEVLAVVSALDGRLSAIESKIALLQSDAESRTQREATDRAHRTRNYALAIPIAVSLIGAAAALGSAVVQGPMTATARAQSAEVASQRLDEQLNRERALLEEQTRRSNQEWIARISALRIEWDRQRMEDERKSYTRTAD